jgi:hypothetical protein
MAPNAFGLVAVQAVTRMAESTVLDPTRTAETSTSPMHSGTLTARLLDRAHAHVAIRALRSVTSARR